MSDAHHINLTDGPRWDYGMTVTDTDGTRVRIAFVSPNDLPDLPPGPLPTQANIDAERGRKPGVLLRLWWWFVGEPRVVKASDLPADGGAALIRGLVTLMCGPLHAALIARLPTATVFEIRQTYLAAQEHWCKAVYDWAAGSFAASDRPAGSPGVDAMGRTVLPASQAAEHLAALFGPPANRMAAGIGEQPSATSDQPSGDEPIKIVGLKSRGGGDHRQNGQVGP